MRQWLGRVGAALLVAACLAAAGLLWCNETGKCVFTGRYLQARDGSHMVIDRQGSPIILTPPQDQPHMLDRLDDGDRVLVVCGGVLTSYPGRSGVYWCLRLGGGSPKDLPAHTLAQLTRLGWLSAP